MIYGIKKYKKDIISVAALIIIALLFGCCAFGLKSGAYAVVRVDGSVCGRYPLSRDERVEITDESGNALGNVLAIKGGEAYMESASCPDRLCVKMGHISRNGQSVICLPHKVSVSIEGSKDDGLDAVVGCN